MSNLERFPESLLKQSKEDRLNYFSSRLFAHPKLSEVTKEVISNIEAPAGASFIFIYGPSGVGKTTMRLKVEQELIKNALPGLEADRGQIPVVSVEATGTESNQFSWKDYCTRSLFALDEPLIQHKVDYGSRGVRRNNEGQLIIDPKVPASELRRSLENALIYRRPKAFIIDEAQHMQKTASGRKLQDNMDCLKSIANVTGVLHVLFGTYELLTFRNLSAQLSRRTIDIHLPRYQFDVEEDIRVFTNILWFFQQHLPLEETPDLLTDWEYYYGHCLGCIGILKSWLTRSLKIALDEGSKTLTPKHIEQRALSITQLNTMLKDIKEGEKQLNEDPNSYKQLYESLGGGKIDTNLKKPLSNNTQDSPEGISKSQGRKNNPGKRNPKRDEIGGLKENAS